MYILRQLFFSISVYSGRILTSLQRITVNYRLWHSGMQSDNYSIVHSLEKPRNSNLEAQHRDQFKATLAGLQYFTRRLASVPNKVY